MNSVKRINVLFFENKAGPDYDIDVDDDEKGRNSARRAKLKIMAVCSAPRVDPGK